MTEKKPFTTTHYIAFLPKGLKYLSLFLLAIFLSTALGGCFVQTAKLSGKSYVINGKRYHILASADGYKEKGIASWYGEPFHGRKTASGEVYNMHDISAAHKTLPLHTWVEVRNLNNNKRLVMRINDRGPFIDGRIIDLSRAAAVELGVYRPGTAMVLVTALPPERARRLSEDYKRRKASRSGILAER
jgi:rare lipoprotein A